MPSHSISKDASLSRFKPRKPSGLASIVLAVDWLLLLITASLVAFGLVIVYSAVAGRPDYAFSRQLMGVGIGFLTMIVAWAFDYRLFARLTIPAYVAAIILILLPLIPGLGVEVNGVSNWIMVFGQQIQPAEFAKILMIIAMASLVARYRGKLHSPWEYLKCLAFMLVPVFCVILQPDLGTALVYLVIGMVVLFVGGASRTLLALTIVMGAALIAAILLLDPWLDEVVGRDVFIKEYQMNRLLVFLNEDLDPSGLGYHLRQAKIAIGTGGFTGTGYMQGAQSTLGFLPEAPTDFIFCVLAEEFGFVGSLFLIVLYATLIFTSLGIALKADALGALIVAGAIGMWVFQILENIGMTCGLMPITGIPLPFMSYGSSFMVVNFVAIGLIGSVSLRTSLDAMVKPGLDAPEVL